MMKTIKRTFSSLLAILLVIGMMAGSVLPASAATLAGDVNTDGKVDLLDVLITLRLIAGNAYNGKKNIRGMFVNGDSVANTADAVLLLRNTAGWEDAVLTAPADSVKDAAFKEPSDTCPSYYYGAEVNVFDQNIRHSSDTYYENNDKENGAPYYSYTTSARIERFHTIMDNYDPDVVGLQEYRHTGWYTAWEGASYSSRRVALDVNTFGTAYTTTTTSDSILGEGYSGYIQMRDDPNRDSVTDAIAWYEEYADDYAADPENFNRLQYAYQPEECVAVFWKTADYNLLEKGVFWINDANEDGTSKMFEPAPGNASDSFPVETVTNDAGQTYWQNNYNRLCIWVKLEEKDTGIVFYYANTHLYSSDDHYSIPAAQIVMDEMDLVMENNGEAPLIINGDFNLPDTCTAYNNLIEKYNDVAVEMGCDEDTFSAYTRVWEGKTTQSLARRIDFIFTEDKGGTADTLTCKVVKDTATGTYTDTNGTVHTYEDDVPSDHRGLCADILINN